MESLTSYCYDRSITEPGRVCPVSALDGVLHRGEKPSIKYYCPSTGNPLTNESFQLAQDNARNKVYPGTDHTPIEITVGGQRVLYFSLDSSNRSNEVGHSLIANDQFRLKNMCAIVKKINPDVVFFSEACRKCYNGSVREPKDVVYWAKVKCIITELTGMIFRTEQANNFSPEQMAFGVAMFSRPGTEDVIEIEQGIQLLGINKEIGFWGNGAVLVKFKTGEVVVGIQFPLDFKGEGEMNHGYRAMSELIKLLSGYEKACAIGDFNAVQGKIENGLRLALTETEWKLSRNCCSFLPSHFDTIPDNEGIEVIPKTYL